MLCRPVRSVHAAALRRSEQEARPPGAATAPLIRVPSRVAARASTHLLPRWAGSDPDRLECRRTEASALVPQLEAHPDCQFGAEGFVATEVTDSGEHDRLYALAEQIYAGYGHYRVQTAAVGRQIPGLPTQATLTAACSRCEAAERPPISDYVAPGREATVIPMPAPASGPVSPIDLTSGSCRGYAS